MTLRSPRLLSFVAVLLALAPGGFAAAQARPDSTARPDTSRALDAVRVRAAYTPRVIGSASAVSVTPDSMPLGAAAPAMGDVLRQLPFLYVRQNSRGETEISVRGSESRQAAVLFEGVPLSLSWDARADVSAVPMAGVNRVDYVRGLSSLLSGPNAIGGVITASLWADHDPTRAPERNARAEVQLDQFGGARSSATLGGALQHSAERSVQYRVGAGWRDLPGLARPVGVNEPDGNRRLRSNTDARALDAFAGLRYEHAQGRYLSGFATITDGARGVAPELHLSQPRLWRNPEVRRQIAGVSAGTGAITSRLGIGDAEVSFGINDGRTEIHGFTNRDFSVIGGTEIGEDRTTSLRMTFDQQLGERVVLRGAYTESRVRYLETINDDPTSTYRQRLSSIASEVDFTPTRFLTFVAGLSQDAASTDEAGGRPPLGRQDGLGWRSGVTWLLPLQGLRLHASASERKRFPALRELYAGALNRFVPNPDLKPETAHSAEMGATFVRGRWDVHAVLFAQRIDDAVVRVTLPSRQFQRINRDRFTSRGVELTAGTLAGPIALRGDLAVQRARIADATIQEATLRRPEDVPDVYGSLLATIALTRGFEANLRGRMLGVTRCTNADSGLLERQAGAGTVDLGLERRWTSRRITAAIQMENALDRALYDKCGLPQVGRTLRFGLRIG